MRSETLLTILALCCFTPALAKDWSGEHPARVVEKIVEVPVEKVVEKLVEVTKLSPPPQIEFNWSEEFLNLEQKEITPEVSLVWWEETNQACNICKDNWASLEHDQTLKSGNWIVGGENGHFRQVDVPFDKVLPNWVLKRNGKEIRRLVGRQHSITLRDIYLQENSQAVSSIPQTAINVGTIDNCKASIDIVMSIIGDQGSLSCTGKPQKYVLNGLNLNVPANLRASCVTKGDEVTATFSQPILVQWSRLSMVSLSISGFVYDKQTGTMTCSSPLSLVNPVITFK